MDSGGRCGLPLPFFTTDSLRSARHRTSVLIIDDEIQSSDALVRLLSLDGFQVVCTQTGTDGVVRALASSWDVILLDLHLPDVLGITVLNDLRRHGLRTPVLVMSGWYLDDGHQRAAAALGAAGFVRKPIAADDLGRVLRSTVLAPHPIAGDCQASFEITHTGPGRRSDQKRVSAQRERDHVLSSLYERGLAGDPGAVDHLCELVLPMLERSIGGGRTPGQREWIHDAVQDALMEFRADIHHFDPARGVPLRAFLRIAARRNLLNRIDTERRRDLRETSGTGCPMVSPRGAPNYERRLDLRHTVSALWSGLTNIERRVFRLVIQGERSTEVLAHAAEVEHLELIDRRRAVKRITNRLFQRLRRMRTPG
jgi:CheY-like chemotaxis protein